MWDLCVCVCVCACVCVRACELIDLGWVCVCGYVCFKECVCAVDKESSCLHAASSKQLYLCG